MFEYDSNNVNNHLTRSHTYIGNKISFSESNSDKMNELFKNIHLRKLELYNTLMCTSSKYLMAAMKHNTSIKTLNVSDNLLWDEDAGAIADMIAGNTTLTTFDFTYNSVSPVGFQPIIDALKINTSLTEFDLEEQLPEENSKNELEFLLLLSRTLKAGWNEISSIKYFDPYIILLNFKTYRGVVEDIPMEIMYLVIKIMLIIKAKEDLYPTITF
eukprot:TRINITY_DN6607_c0_g1_i1.p2 TRINITY_DN6607_c0_g1~~TRINITY_DN6607_c0_g1_i1.p2  ORF type:complete len:214 (-),score=54.10 TRINITY_DN6607_c0_g1_i1:47-688(-)